jgi:hypothetical protein
VKRRTKQATDESPANNFCISCGASLPPVARFCSSCGMAVVGLPAAFESPPRGVRTRDATPPPSGRRIGASACAPPLPIAGVPPPCPFAALTVAESHDWSCCVCADSSRPFLCFKTSFKSNHGVCSKYGCSHLCCGSCQIMPSTKWDCALRGCPAKKGGSPFDASSSTHASDSQR